MNKIFLIAGLIFLTSCLSINLDKNSAFNQNSSLNNELKGKFSIIEINGEKSDFGKLEFLETGRIAVNVGCNTIGSDYKLKAKQEVQFSQAMSTMRFCNDQTNKKELLMGDLLPKITRYQFIKGNQIRLETNSDAEYIILEK